MKKTLLHILFAAALVGSFTACQREAMLPEAGQVPAFTATVSGEPLTKAAPYAGTSLPETVSLGVLAYRYTTSKAAASAWALHASTEAVCDKGRSGASSRKWVPANRFLWPDKDHYVRYFGYAPYGAAGLTVTAADGTAPQLSFTVDADYTKQVDLLVTDQASTQQYRGDPAVTAIDVPFTLDHALTGVRFRIKSGISISSVSVNGVYRAGTLSLSNLSSGWTPSGQADGSYTLTSPTLKTDASKAGYDIVDDEYTLLLLPQTLTDAAYIEATFTDGSISATVTASLKGEVWEPGKLVVYTISDGESLEPESYYLGQMKSTGIPFPHFGDTQMISKDANFQSYAVMKDGSKRPVPFVLEYFVGGTSAPAANAAGWTTTPPSWVAASYNGAGSMTGEPIMITVVPQVNSATDPYHAPLSNKTPKTDFDLSTSGGTASRSTANSYVVDAPGTYRIPLVYGNGIKNGSANPSAYSGFGATDHLEQAITSPYIALQHPGKSLDAKLLWTDVPGLVGNVSLSGSGADACLCFDVPADYITQGNACVAVLADGVVAWSWHIWVTDATDGNGRLTPVDGPGGYSFSPVNLGWCAGKDAERYEARPAKLGNDVTYCWIRARQTQSGNTSNIGRIRQEEKIFENATSGNNPFYQWGRKDLMAAGNGFTNDSYGNTQKTYYTAPGYALLHWEDGPVSIGTGIRTPTRFYNRNNADIDAYVDWVYPQNTSLWQDGQKTIYDPSPAGYRVPPKTAFDALVTQGSTWGDNPPGRSVGSLFFPASGFRAYGAGCRIMSTGAHGSYWTTTFASQYAVYGLSFGNSSFSVFDKNTTTNGFPVRPMVE